MQTGCGLTLTLQPPLRYLLAARTKILLPIVIMPLLLWLHFKHTHTHTRVCVCVCDCSKQHHVVHDIVLAPHLMSPESAFPDDFLKYNAL